MPEEYIFEIENWDTSWEWDHISPENLDIPYRFFEEHFAERENAKTSYEIALHFFNREIPDFWKHFDLMRIITLASLFKSAAYQAYKHNFANFRNFCRKAWDSKTIDFHDLGNFNDKEFSTVQQLFPGKHQIFPDNIPQTIFKYLLSSPSFTFHISNTNIPLIRHHLANIHTDNLFFFGPQSLSHYNNLTDILYHFSYLPNVVFENLILEPFQVIALRIIKIKKLMIKNCITDKKASIELACAIIQSKNVMEELFIEADNEYDELNNTIDILLEKIHLFKKLKSMTISIHFSNANITMLWKIGKINTLRYLKIKDLDNENEIEHEIKIEMLKELKRNNDLMIIFETPNGVHLL